MRIEAFLPSRHGFPCVLQSPGGEDFGLGTPAPGAFGLSAGVAWSALDHYLSGRPVPATDPAPPDSLLEALVRRQGEALARAGWHQLRDWQALPDRGGPRRAGIAERSRTEFRRLRQSLDDGIPVMLYLVLAQGRHADPSQNVAVLAYDYELDRRARRASVRVYDPARPGNDNVRLVFHAGAGKALDARLAVKTPVRGFFCVPYDRPEPAALSLHGAGNEDARLAQLLAVHGSAVDGGFEAIGLGRDGRLLHVRRRRSGGYATEHVDIDVLDGCDVEQAAFVGGGRTVLWTSKGELIDCRRRPGLGWRARRITDTRTHGTFDTTAAGVTRERGRVSLFACGTGRLMHFRRGRLPTWEAEHVDAGPLARAACVGRPTGVRLGSAMHVVARTRSGELMHARWRARGGWTAENITARAGDRERFLVADDPVLLRDRRGRALATVARSKNGSVLLFRWTERRGWRAFDLSAAAGAALRTTLRSDCPLGATIEPDGTVHAVGRTAQGALLHAWCTPEGTTGIQDLVQARPRIGSAARIDSAPMIIAGPSDALHVLAHRESELLLFRWAHNADWSVENVTREREYPRPGQEPLACAEGSVAHVALLDENGRAHHALLVPRGGTGRRLRVPTLLMDVLLFPLTLTGIIADALSALIGLTKKGSAPRAAERPAVRAQGVVARPRVVPAEVVSPARVESGPPAPLPALEDNAAAAPENAPYPMDGADGVEATALPDQPLRSPRNEPPQDDWSADDVPSDEARDLLAGPLDHLLSFGTPATDEALVASSDDTVADVAADDAAVEEGEVVTQGGTDLAAHVVGGVDEAAEVVGRAAGAVEDEAEVTGDLADGAADDVELVACAAGGVDDLTDVTGDVADGVADEIEVTEIVADTVDDARPSDEPVAAEIAQGIVADAASPGVSGTAEQTEADATVTEPAREAAEEGTPGSDELIIVYPEPVKRGGKAGRRKRNRRSDAADDQKADDRKADDRKAETSSADDALPEDADRLPLIDDGKPAADIPADADTAEPWALPTFEVTSPGDDWNAPEDEPWSVTPLEGLETTAAPGDDEWNLPPVEGLQASAPASANGDWSLPPLEGVERDVAPEPASADSAPAASAAVPSPSGDDLHRPSIADTDDDWNLPDNAPAVVPQPIETSGSVDGPVPSRALEALETSEAVEHAPSVKPIEPVESPALPEFAELAEGTAEQELAELPEPSAPAEPMTADSAEPPQRRKWQNPALEGLPLLDDDDAPVAAQPPPPLPPPPPKPSATPVSRKKQKKASANEIERIIALAEASQPELLPPD